MKIAAVSGADRNLGLEMCRELLRRGWTVVAGKFLPRLDYIEKLKQEYPETLVIYPLDVSSDSSVKEFADFIRVKFGRLDMLIHNAAVFGKPCGDITGQFDVSYFPTPFNVNAMGALRLIRNIAPLMDEAGMRRLCFVSSEAGSVSVSHRTEVACYGMSKTALNMVVRLAFNELRPKGYTFRLYHPGWVRSPRQEYTGQVVQVSAGAKFEPAESALPAIDQFLEDRKWEDRLAVIDNEGAAWPF